MAKKKAVAIPAGVPDEMAAFLRALSAKPKDRTTRLVFADWLDEHSDRRSAWLRDEQTWSFACRNLVYWFTPDPRGFLAPLIDALDPFASANQGDWTAQTLLTALGTPAVNAVRAWVREGNTFGDIFNRWDVACGIIASHPPPELRPVKKLIKELESESWYDCWEAVTDLGFYGPAAAPAVKALEKVSRRYWDELEQMEQIPVERAAYCTLGKIGPAALAAVPLLASAVHYADEATDALLALGADPDLVAKHICADEDSFARRGVSVVWRLDSQGTGSLVRLLKGSVRKATAAAETLGWMREKAADAVPGFVAAFEELKGHWHCHELRRAFAEALADIGSPAKPALPTLRAALAGYEEGAQSDRYLAGTRDAIAAAITKLETALKKPRRKKK